MKKKLTLIELIIAILVLGLLVALAMPRFTDAKSNAVVETFRTDVDVLEKAFLQSFVVKDELPVGEKVTGLDEGLMEIVYAFGGSDDDLYRVDFEKSSKFHKDLKNKETDTDFYVYSKDAEKIFFTKGFVDSKGRVYHTLEYVGLTGLEINTEKLKNKMFVLETDNYILEGKSLYGEKVKVFVNNNPTTVNQSVAKNGYFNNIHAAGSEFSSQVPLEFGTNKITIGTENYSTNFTVFVINESDVDKPIAVIDMTPENGINTETSIFWDYSNSYSLNGANIVAAEWMDKETIYTTPGEKTVSLRVKDSNEVWSDWITKTFTVDGVEEIIPSTVEYISVSQLHSIALMSDKTVRVWGNGSAGALGLGNTDNVSIPTALDSLNNVKQVDSYITSSYALLEDGSVYAWGQNIYGQLGLGDKTTRLIPTKIESLPKIKKIHVSSYNVYAISENGEVYGWGNNMYGAFGNGTVIGSESPIVLENFTDVKEIYAGEFHSLFKKNDGTFWAVGLNSAGQFGLGHTVSIRIPIQITSLSDVKQVYVGSQITYVVFNDGTVKSAGLNTDGQLGVGDKVNKSVFTNVLKVQNQVEKISTFGRVAYFLLSNNELFFTGVDQRLSTGYGVTNPNRKAYFVSDIATQGGQSYMMYMDGTIGAWGNNINNNQFIIE